MRRLAPLLFVACAHVPTPQSLLAEGREADALEAALSARVENPMINSDAEDERIDRIKAITTAIRVKHYGRVRARVLSADDLASMVGARPTERYGKTIVIVESEIVAGAEMYSLAGFGGFRMPDETRGYSRPIWSCEPIANFEHSVSEVELTQYINLYPPPPPPGAHCTGGTPGKTDITRGLIGLFLLATGVTPIASLITANDQIAPFFRTEGGTPSTCTMPTAAEFDAWSNSPPVKAARALHSMLFAGQPPAKRVLTLVEYVADGFHPEKSSLPAYFSVSLGIRIERAGKPPIKSSDLVDIPLRAGDTVEQRVRATFGDEGIDVRPLTRVPLPD